MKKLFTLALILLGATMGYSQVKKISLTRSDGELDYTTYDWQTNWGNINRTIVWPDGKVSFAYTMSDSESFIDIGTGIGIYDSNNDEWIPSEGRIECEKTYFGSIARYQENSIVIAANTTTEVGVYIVEDKDNMMPNSAFAVSYLNPINDPTCPVVMTSGTNRAIIHIIATGSDDKLYYFRSTDGGLTWDKENEILPYLSEEYGSFWGSHLAYWMETTEDNCLALVVNNPWSDGMVIYSYDDGDTWERKVFYHHPGINTTFDDWFMYPRWASCVWGADNELCLAYEFNGSIGEPSSSIYYPALGGVAFWSESLPYQGSGQPFIMDSDYIKELWDSSPYFQNPPYQMRPEYFGYVENGGDSLEFHIEDFSLHGDYRCGPVAMPILCKVPGTENQMVAVFMAMDLNHTDNYGNYYFKLFASCSFDGGRNWTPQVHLTDDFMLTYTECVYPQAAIVGTNLIVVCQMDEVTGSYAMENDPDPFDSYFQGLTFDINSLFPPVPLPGNGEWYYEIQNSNGSITYQHLECAGDTTIANERPKIIVRSNTHYDRDTITEVTHEYIYDDNGVVYWWNKDLEEFTILYDLTANVGDEWEIQVGTESLTMHVDAVQYYEYEGRTYRMLSVSDPDDLFSGDIVCGVGHLSSFFPERLMRDTEGFRVNGLRCYWVDDKLVFKMSEEDCDAIYGELHGLEEDGPSTNSGTLAVYPNPTNDVLFVETQNIASLPEPTYRITNVLGQTILLGSINAETQQIDIKKLPSGMYFISVGGQTVKFVVE
jgi:hypothetical protein